MKIKLEKLSGHTAKNEVWEKLFSGFTNSDGRIMMKQFPTLTEGGTFRVTFDTEHYFKDNNITKYFYPYVTIVFQLELGQHYHIPLLISPFGYSTYRGS